MSLSAITPVSPAELEARLRLHRLPELGPARFKKLLEAFGSASKAISAPASAWRSLGVPLVCAQARRSNEIRDGASHALAWLERPGQHLLMWDQPEYRRCWRKSAMRRRCYLSPGIRAFWKNRNWRWSQSSRVEARGGHGGCVFPQPGRCRIRHHQRSGSGY